MTSQEAEDFKDSSSLIIVKSIKQFGPYAYHPVLVLLNAVHNTPEKIQNAVLLVSMVRPSVHTFPS